MRTPELAELANEILQLQHLAEDADDAERTSAAKRYRAKAKKLRGELETLRTAGRADCEQ